MELREGNQAARAVAARGGMEIRSAMTPKMLLDLIRISTDSIAACDDDLTMNLILADSGGTFFPEAKFRRHADF